LDERAYPNVFHEVVNSTLGRNRRYQPKHVTLRHDSHCTKEQDQAGLVSLAPPSGERVAEGRVRGSARVTAPHPPFGHLLPARRGEGLYGGLQRYEPLQERPAHCVRAVLGPQFAADRGDVKFHGVLGDLQACGNPLVGKAEGEQI